MTSPTSLTVAPLLWLLHFLGHAIILTVRCRFWGLARPTRESILVTVRLWSRSPQHQRSNQDRKRFELQVSDRRTWTLPCCTTIRPTVYWSNLKIMDFAPKGRGEALLRPLILVLRGP